MTVTRFQQEQSVAREATRRDESLSEGNRTVIPSLLIVVPGVHEQLHPRHRGPLLWNLFDSQLNHFFVDHSRGLSNRSFVEAVIAMITWSQESLLTVTTDPTSRRREHNNAADTTLVTMMRSAA